MDTSTLPKYDTLRRPALLIIICLFSSLFSYAQYGVLDPGFGNGGMVTTAIPGYNYLGTAIMALPNGQILAVGDKQLGIGSSQMSLSRYNSDGSLDSTFGQYGIACTPLSPTDEWGSGIAIEKDGRILVSGYFNEQFTVSRFRGDGSVDNSFGNNGMVITPFGLQGGGFAPAVKSLPDGSVLMVGTGFPIEQDIPNGILILKLQPDGHPDGMFGRNGFVMIAGIAHQWYSSSMSIQCDGKIVVARISDTLSSAQVVLRFNPDGSLDNTFGSGGMTFTATPAADQDYINGNYADIAPDGKIVVAGQTRSNQGTDKCILIRYNIDGSPDSTFGIGGIAEVENIDSRYGGPASLVIQPDGKIIIGGTTNGYMPDITPNMIRFNRDGSIDTTFGNAGQVQENIGQYIESTGLVTMQVDGKILQIGGVYDPITKQESLTIQRFISGINAGRADTCEYRFISVPDTGSYGTSVLGQYSLFPNPFNGTDALTIAITMNETAYVSIGMFDIYGRLVMPFGEATHFDQGYHQLNFLPINLPQGPYILGIRAASQTYYMKVVKVG